jgi:hypothetical protein
MSNYKIEGDIDFYAELYKSLDDVDENIIISSNDENKCLITDSPLTDKFVTMKCGHKFNYEPLYKDILNHKQKFNAMESSKSTLLTHEIRCPYCRKIQSELLPYYQELDFPKKNGVNYFDPKTKIFNNTSSCKAEHCQYEIVNQYYDINKPEDSSLNAKTVLCGKYFSYPISIFNDANPSEPITYNDTKCYCYVHKKIMIKKYKQEEKQKEKDALKQAKMEAKLEKEHAKLVAKQEKASKTKIKNIPTNIEENVNLGNIIIGEESNGEIWCVQILKTGPNKGKQCGCRIFLENRCKRHSYTLLEKVEQK